MLFKKQQPKVHLTGNNKMEVNVVDKFYAAEPQTPWRSILVVSIFTFFTATQFTLYFSSLWPFLQILDHSASEAFYGWIIAVYSLGQILSGPVVGWWSTKTRSIVNPALCCLVLTFIGNIIYVSASLMESNQKWFVLLGRFFVGMGESSLSLYQGFASTASTHKDRSKALSITTGGLALGFSFGPALQLLFTPFGYPGYHIFGKLYLNMYTAGALSCCVINILCMIGLKVLFVERYAGLANPDVKSGGEKKIIVPKYDRKAVAVCHLTRFVQLFSFTNLETIGTPFVMAMFALNSQETVKTLSIVHSISGLLGFCIYIVHAIRKTEIIDYRKLCIIAFCGFLSFFILTIPLPFNAGQLITYSAEEYEAYKLTNKTGVEPVGCPIAQFDWCLTTGSVNIWIYLVMMTLILGVFWPNLNVSLSTLLSKILGPRRQANQQSMFQMSASFARLIGPILISNIYTNVGPFWAWIVSISVLVMIIIVWLFQYKRMIPLKMPEHPQPVVPSSASDSEDFYEEDAVEENEMKFARF